MISLYKPGHHCKCEIYQQMKYQIPNCWGIYPTDGLALMWHIPTKFSSELSRNRHQERTLIFMMVLSWGGVSPSYRLCMYYFLSIYFLSHISEPCYHFNLPLTITLINSARYSITVYSYVSTEELAHLNRSKEVRRISKADLEHDIWYHKVTPKEVWFGLVWFGKLFNGISTSGNYLLPKQFF